MYFVYILKSELNGKSYTGSTSKEASKRLAEHNIGSNLWTKNNRPFKLIYYESYICKTDAILRENFLKTGVGKKLKKLILENYGA
jgi:putative endonuclease